MYEIKVRPVPAEIAQRAHVNEAQYLEMYQRSLDDTDGLLGGAGGGVLNLGQALGQGLRVRLPQRGHPLVRRGTPERIV